MPGYQELMASHCELVGRLEAFERAQTSRVAVGNESVGMMRAEARWHVEAMFKCTACGMKLPLNATALLNWLALGGRHEEWPYPGTAWTTNTGQALLFCSGPGTEDCEAAQVEKALASE